MRRLSIFLAPLVLIAALILIWEIACRVLNVPIYLLPPPSAIGAALQANAPALLVSALNTLVMAIEALVAAAVLAIPLALASSLSPIVGRAISPIAVVLQVTPVVAIAPLVVIWAGLDHPERAITALAAIVAFFPIYSGAVTGLRSADPDLERLFDLYGATRRQRLIRLRIPAAAPFALEGIKVAAGLAVIGAVVAEFVAGSGGAQGLAWRILEAGNRLRTAEMFAALFVLGALGAGLNAAFQLGERALLKTWRGR